MKGEDNMELTREYLYEHYIVQDKSQTQIAKELGIGDGKVDYWIRKYDFNFKRTDPDRVFNLSHIDANDPIFCYYAGLVATDGYLDYKNKRISLRVNNVGSDKVLENIRNYFGFVRPIREYHNKRVKHILYDLTIPNKCIFNELEKMGIYGDKGNRTFSIEWFNNSSSSCKYMFLRGILDGDGNFHGGAFRLSMGSKSFVENLIQVFNTICEDTYELKYTSNSSKKKYPNITLHTADTTKVFRLIYNDFEQYRFDDKYNTYLETVNK